MTSPTCSRCRGDIGEWERLYPKLERLRSRKPVALLCSNEGQRMGRHRKGLVCTFVAEQKEKGKGVEDGSSRGGAWTRARQSRRQQRGSLGPKGRRDVRCRALHAGQNLLPTHLKFMRVRVCSRASQTLTALAHLCSAYYGLWDPTAMDSAPTTTWLATTYPTHHRGETS